MSFLSTNSWRFYWMLPESHTQFRTQHGCLVIVPVLLDPKFRAAITGTNAFWNPAAPDLALNAGPVQRAPNHLDLGAVR
jgi:hypothetical protein